MCRGISQSAPLQFCHVGPCICVQWGSGGQLSVPPVSRNRCQYCGQVRVYTHFLCFSERGRVWKHTHSLSFPPPLLSFFHFLPPSADVHLLLPSFDLCGTQRGPSDGSSVVHLAAAHSDAMYLRLLLEKQADVDVGKANDDGDTPLHRGDHIFTHL